MSENQLKFAPATQQPPATTIEQTRAAQEVQAAMIVAKKFPRDQNAAYLRIIDTCKRISLAKESMYVFPRGSQTVTGPSIRLAEAIAQSWGNIDFGVIELDNKDGESSVMSYAWDLETNTRQTKIFTVKHIRKAHGKINKLTDPRDIYEMTANQGARRLRACILGVIPGDVVDAAVAQCEKTLMGGDGKPMADRIREMLVKFKEVGVTKEMVEFRLQHKIETTIPAELVSLGNIYKSLSDNMAKREDFFVISGSEGKTTTETKDLTEKIKGKEKPKDLKKHFSELLGKDDEKLMGVMGELGYTNVPTVPAELDKIWGLYSA